MLLQPCGCRGLGWGQRTRLPESEARFTARHRARDSALDAAACPEDTHLPSFPTASATVVPNRGARATCSLVTTAERVGPGAAPHAAVPKTAHKQVPAGQGKSPYARTQLHSPGRAHRSRPSERRETPSPHRQQQRWVSAVLPALTRSHGAVPAAVWPAAASHRA